MRDRFREVSGGFAAAWGVSASVRVDFPEVTGDFLAVRIDFSEVSGEFRVVRLDFPDVRVRFRVVRVDFFDVNGGFLAKSLGLSKSQVSLEKGGSSRFKTFEIPDGIELP